MPFCLPATTTSSSSIMASLDDQPQQPVASSSTTPLCAQCSSQPAKYTCPGCSTKTCVCPALPCLPPPLPSLALPDIAPSPSWRHQSLPCSKAHKVSTTCSGKRNPASYVPMNAYSYASMVSDYTFLSGVGRTLDAATAAVGVPNAMPPGPGNKAGGGGSASFKTEGLRRRMNEAGLGGVRFMPEGMERRSKNQTRWNMKSVQCFSSRSLFLLSVSRMASSKLTRPLARMSGLNLSSSPSPFPPNLQQPAKSCSTPSLLARRFLRFSPNSPPRPSLRLTYSRTQRRPRPSRRTTARWTGERACRMC